MRVRRTRKDEGENGKEKWRRKGEGENGKDGSERKESHSVRDDLIGNA
jgi:hypothetical protein